MLIIVALAVAGIALVLLALPPSKAQATASTTAPPPPTTPSAGATAANVPPQGAPPPASATTNDLIIQDAQYDPWQFWGFTHSEPNTYLCVVEGQNGKGRVVRYIDTDNLPVRQGLTGDLIRGLEGVSGRVYFGTPFVTSLRKPAIDRVIRNQTQNNNPQATLLEELLATGMVRKDGLRKLIYRPTYHRAIDTADGVRFNLNTYVVYRVFNPEVAFMVYLDSFLQTLSQLDGTFVSSQALPLKWEQYKGLKVNVGSKFKIADFDTILLPIKTKVETYNVSDPEIVKESPAVQAALELVIIAREEAKKLKVMAAATRDKTILEAAGKAAARLKEAEAEAKAIERLAKAEQSRFDELFAAFSKGGRLSEVEAIRLAQQTVVAEANAKAIGNLTYYGNGTGASGVQLVVPAGSR